MGETRKIPNGIRGGRYMGPPGKFNKNSFKRLLGYMLKYKYRYVIVIICILISSLVQVSGKLFFKTLIDDYLTPLIGESNPVFLPLIKFLSVISFVYLIGVFATFLYNRIMIYISQGILKNIRDDMFNHMETLPISYFDTNSHGDIMSRYTNDINAIRQMLSQSIPSLVSSLFSIIGILISMLYLNIPLTILVLVGVFIMINVSKNIAIKSGKYFVKQQEDLGKLNGYIEEMIEGQKVIKVFTHEEISKKDFDKLNNELFSSGTLANSYGSRIGPITNNIGTLISVFIAFFGSLIAIYTKSFTLGGIAAFLYLAKSFTQPISMITVQFNSVVMALAGCERIFKLLDEKSEENNGKVKLVNVNRVNNKLVESRKTTGLWAWKRDKELIELKGDVRFFNVNFSYVEGKEVIHDVSLYAKPGQKIAFVGSTGAGKTTITNLLNKFYDIDSGTITYDGIDINEINKDDLRKSLGMVLQDTNLFTGTIMENIRYGNKEATDEDCIKAAKLVNADKFIKMLPDGYNTVISGSGSSLSQGQRQLLSIARCAVSNPPVMILDEATSSIDTRTEKIVQDGMDKLMKGRTVFVIAHRLSTVHNSNAIMVMEHGKIIERGNHEELINQKGEYYSLYTGAFELE